MLHTLWHMSEVLLRIIHDLKEAAFKPTFHGYACASVRYW